MSNKTTNLKKRLQIAEHQRESSERRAQRSDRVAKDARASVPELKHLVTRINELPERYGRTMALQVSFDIDAITHGMWRVASPNPYDMSRAARMLTEDMARRIERAILDELSSRARIA